MTDKNDITIRRGVGGKGTTNFWTYSVLLDGRTKRTFASSERAEQYALELRKAYPNKTHNNKNV